MRFDRQIQTMSPGNVIANFIHRLGGFAKDARGMAAIEMAFIFPVMVLLYFGLVDVSNVMSADRKVTMTASTIADLTTQAPGTITKADLDGIFKAAKPIMDPFDPTTIGLQVYGYELVNNTVKLSWQHSSGPSCGSTPSPTAQMKAMMADGNDLVVARSCYAWQPVTGKVVGLGNITLNDQLILRPRKSAKLTCSDC